LDHVGKGSQRLSGRKLDLTCCRARVRHTYRYSKFNVTFALVRVEVQHDGVGEWITMWDAHVGPSLRNRSRAAARLMPSPLMALDRASRGVRSSRASPPSAWRCGLHRACRMSTA
jgi:hypothetical protein